MVPHSVPVDLAFVKLLLRTPIAIHELVSLLKLIRGNVETTDDVASPRGYV